ncbi:hypothetical protein [Haloarchaeobius iranensis]|uniref:Phosphohydrolase n=1 Tax=Haloarchaeobius iranensis TaxID=996166 RepID=A0A1G9U2R0_9EURY|nr:hypothetical protein [Haloarchaeobius iranensis]SDM54320.1 hypothetical protein SAMN05192554_103277 [Haloarchaeobius iranensis]
MKLATDPTPNERDAAISTQSGRTVRPFDPDPEAVDLADLAHGTANVCRAAGQSRFFYSVALHSLYVSRELGRAGEDERTQLYGLLHDASEAYVADVPGPLKKHLPNYKRAEKHVQDAIWAAFELEPPTDEAWAAVKRADGRLQRYELPVLIPSQEWEGDRPALGYDLRLDATDDVPALFESRATELVEATDAGRP